jgi:hypothetical protein
MKLPKKSRNKCFAPAEGFRYQVSQVGAQACQTHQFKLLMKRIVFLLPALALVSGCYTHYDITLQNGQVITALNKPVYDKDKGIFTYKTMATIPAGMVLQVAPSGAKKTKDSHYLPVPKPPGQ